MPEPSAENARLEGVIDSHCHLTDERLGKELEAVLERARAAGLERLVTVSSEVGDPEAVVALCDAHGSDALPIDCAIGVHPHEAASYTDEHEATIERLARERRGAPVLAVGEIGLDYHYDHSPRERQQDVFRRQLRLAKRLDLPVVIHSREAEEDTARILEEEDARAVGGVLHCFTSSRNLAERALELDFVISLSGIATFGSAADLRETAKAVPAGRLMVETDSPYLAPVPHRGKRCEPAFVVATARRLAEERGESPEDFVAASRRAFRHAFRLD